MRRKLLSFIAWMSIASTVSFGQGNLERIVRHDAASGFTIITDTIGIDLSDYTSPLCNMKLSSVMKCNGNNLCTFRAYNYTAFFIYLDKTKTVSISHDNDRQMVIEDPPLKPGERYTLFVRNDTLCLRNMYGIDDKYWDENYQRWIETDSITNTCYEDEDFAVSFIDHGEWGYYTCFFDKKTGATYIFNADLNKIVRYHDSYFIISDIAIYEIKDPRTGLLMGEKPYTDWFSIAPKGETVISTKYQDYWEYEYSFADDHSQDTLFFSGYIYNDNLYVLAGNTEELYLAQVRPTDSSLGRDRREHPKFHKVLDLEKPGSWRPHHHNLSNNWNPYSSLGRFHVDWHTDAILDLHADTVHFTYLRTEPDTLQNLGPKAWTKIMDFLSDNIGKTTMDKVARFERELGGKPDNKIYDSSQNMTLPQHDNDEFKLTSYYHAIDEHDSFKVQYCYNKETNVVASVYIDFAETRHFDGENYIWKLEEERNITKDNLPTMMEQYLASPPDSIDMKNENYPGRYWHRHGHTYSLHDDCITIY